MDPVRLGAVEYLNARPLVFGLERLPRFALRFDLPSRCADLLHAGTIDLGLIPSIEYSRRPAGSMLYSIVPDLAIASHGPVASVAIYTTRPMADVRSIALDTSSRTSVALVRVLCDRVFKIRPALEPRGPDLADMLARSDAALLIGDQALMTEAGPVVIDSDGDQCPVDVEKIDLGQLWAASTGLPFVYAFWAGRIGSVTSADVLALQQARNLGVGHHDEIAREYFADSQERQVIGARYLRDNIQYSMGIEERAGLEAFYRYAVEAGALERADELRFF